MLLTGGGGVGRRGCCWHMFKEVFHRLYSHALEITYCSTRSSMCVCVRVSECVCVCVLRARRDKTRRCSIRRCRVCDKTKYPARIYIYYIKGTIICHWLPAPPHVWRHFGTKHLFLTGLISPPRPYFIPNSNVLVLARKWLLTHFTVYQRILFQSVEMAWLFIIIIIQVEWTEALGRCHWSEE